MLMTPCLSQVARVRIRVSSSGEAECNSASSRPRHLGFAAPITRRRTNHDRRGWWSLQSHLAQPGVASSWQDGTRRAAAECVTEKGPTGQFNGGRELSPSAAALDPQARLISVLPGVGPDMRCCTCTAALLGQLVHLFFSVLAAGCSRLLQHLTSLLPMA